MNKIIRGGAERLEWLDRAKAMAVFLVVFAHALNVYMLNTVIYQFIYLFHMPFFFMISGVSYEMFSRQVKRDKIIKSLKKRECNLLVPIVVFTVINYLVHSSNWNLDNYYNGIWYILFLSCFIFAEGIIALLSESFDKIQSICIWMAGGIWLLFGVLQITEMTRNNDVARMVREISKFAGYYLCFLYGKRCVQKQFTFRVKWKAKLIGVAVAVAITFGLAMNDNVSIFKIICGFLGGSILLNLYYISRERRCCIVEHLMAKYSLEIYLIHLNIINKMILPMTNYDILDGWKRIFMTLILLVVDFAIPILIGVLSEYIDVIKFIFHPYAVISKYRFGRKEC